MNFRKIAEHYIDNYNCFVIPVLSKRTSVKWKSYIEQDDPKRILDFSNWGNKVTGLAGISGKNNLRCLDFDDVHDKSIVDEFLSDLGLVNPYEWHIRSGSGKGYHIWFLCNDDEYEINTLLNSKSVKVFKPKSQKCKQIELRWKNCYTILPPSLHESQVRYKFTSYNENELPLCSPIKISAKKLAYTLEKLCLSEAYAGNERNSNLKLYKPESNFKIDSKSNEKPPETDSYEIDHVEKVAQFLSKKINNYNDFLRIGFALASGGEKLRKYFLKITANNPNYPDDTNLSLNKKFDLLLRDYDGSITLPTLFQIAKKYGYKLKSEIKNEVHYLTLAQEYLSSIYVFRYNELTHKIECSLKDKIDFKEFSDIQLNSIYTDINSIEKIKIKKSDLQAIVESNYVKKFNPIVEYLDSLPEWDEIDYIKKLSGTVKCCEIDQKFWCDILKKWLIGCVAGVLSEEVNHFAIILQGDQNIGKSRWIRQIVPSSLQKYLFTGCIHPNSKDSLLNTVNNFIVNLDELETSSRGEIGHLKSIMTEKYFDIRKPYGRYSEKHKRQSSFIGSVNKKEFLTDQTGSRRFVCFEVKSIKDDHQINIDQVFSQALFLYHNKERYWLNKEESDEITRRNEKFTLRTIEEEKLLKNFVPTNESDEDALFLTATDIAERLFKERSHDNRTVRRIGEALSKNKFTLTSKWTSNGSRKGWLVKTID